MIRIPLPNKQYIEEVTRLSRVADRNTLSLHVFDADNLRKKDKILISNPGYEQARVHAITDIVNQRLYVTPATEFAYSADTVIQKIYWQYYMAEISYDDGESWISLQTGDIPYSKEYILISKVPWYPKDNPKAQSPRIRYKYYVNCNSGKNNIEETDWFETSANPYVSTIVGNTDTSFMRIESMVAKCQEIYGDREGTAVDSDVWLMWFNMCLNELHMLTGTMYPDKDKEIYPIITTPKIGTYYLPFSTSQLLALRVHQECKISPYSGCTTVLKLGNSVVHNEQGCDAEGKPCNNFPPRYYVQRESIVLDPIPEKEYTLIVEYNALPFRFTYERTSLEMEQMHEELFVFFALSKQFAFSNDSRAKEAKETYKQLYSQFIGWQNEHPKNKGNSGEHPLPLSDVNNRLGYAR